MALKRYKGDPGQVVVLEHVSAILKDNPLGDPHVRPLWVYLPPGYDDAPERRYPTVYVIQGGQVQVPGKDPQAIPTGATLQFLRDAKHAGFKIVGDSPVKLFTVHVVDKGKPLYDYQQ